MTATTAAAAAATLPAVQVEEALLPQEEDVKQQQQLRTSIHKTLSEFNFQGSSSSSVKPSLLAMAASSSSSSSSKAAKRILQPKFPVNTVNVNKKKEITPSKKTTNSSGELEGLVTLQSLLDALSFSPSHNKENDNSKSSNNKDVPATKAFAFDSPKKTTKKMVLVTNNNLKTPSWVTQRRVATPPTASLEEDEQQSVGGDGVTPSSSTTDQQSTTTTTTTDMFSPVRSFRHPNSSSVDAVALAYPLSLPIEVMQSQQQQQSAESTYNETKKNNNFNNSNHNSNKKPAKKFPTVDTNIPGAGVRRSSLSHKNPCSSTKLSFVHMVHSPISGSSSRSLMLRGQQQQLAQHIYGQVKDVWAQGKNAGVPMVAPLMGVAEEMVAWTAGIVMGDDDNATDGSDNNNTLGRLDHDVIVPLVAAIDAHVLHPVVDLLGGTWQRIFGNNDGEEQQ